MKSLVEKGNKKVLKIVGVGCFVVGICFVTYGVCAYIINGLLDEAAKREDERIVDIIQQEGLDITNSGNDGIFVDNDEYIGIIEIPSIDLKMPVLSSCDNGNLERGICLYYGDESIVIGGHNRPSRFRPLFDLKINDTLYFYDYPGNKNEYKLVKTEYLMPDQVNSFKSNEYSVTLFTCEWGDERRFVLRFR